MPIKAVLQPDHIQVNKYTLMVAGMPPLTFTAISGIEEELDVNEMPDRTIATGGRTKPVEFDVTQPEHHLIERLAMEAWFSECKDPVSPLHKKVGTLLQFSQTDLVQVGYMLIGLFPSKRALPDLEMENEGEMGSLVWTMRADELLLVS